MLSKNGFAVVALAVLVSTVTLLSADRADLEQAVTYFEAGKYLEAAGEFQPLIDEHPDYAYAYFMLGNCFLKTDKIVDAENNLLKAIELNDDKFEYHYQLANTYVKMGKIDKVVSTLNNAETLAPNEQYKKALYKLRGFANYWAENWEAAAADLSKAGSEVDVVSRLAKSYFKMGDTQAAASAFAGAVKTSPNDPEIRELYAESLLILALKAKSDSEKSKYYKDALTQAKTFQKMKPESFESNNLVGRAALGNKQFDEAVSAFTIALQKDKTRCNAMVNLGKALISKYYWVDAYRSLDNATRCDPNMALAWELKAYTLQMQGKCEEAIPHYEKALSINPGSSFAAANLKHCRQEIREFDELPPPIGEAGRDDRPTHRRCRLEEPGPRQSACGRPRGSGGFTWTGTPMNMEGGCACGSIRYRVDGTPRRVTHCHCLHCRRTSGAAFVTWAEFNPKDVVVLQGVPREYESRSLVTRHFCGDCGTQLTYRHAEEPETIDVTVASLDDPDRIAPEDHVWSDRRLSWVRLADDLPQYRESRFDER